MARHNRSLSLFSGLLGAAGPAVRPRHRRGFRVDEARPPRGPWALSDRQRLERLCGAGRTPASRSGSITTSPLGV